MAPRETPIETRPARADEAATYGRIFVRSLLARTPAGPDWVEGWIQRVGLDNVRVALRRGELTGGLVLLPFGQWFGGRLVSMTGVAAVVVAPEHRSSGVAGALLGAALSELHERGTALAALYPATQPVYRRAGFECAGTRLLYRAPTRSLARRERSCDARPLRSDETPLADELHRERARRSNGVLERGTFAWNRVLRPLDVEVEAHVLERAGRAEGHVVFHREPAPDASHGFDLHVRDLVALTPAALSRALALLGDHRSVSPSTLWCGPPADPLLLHLEEQDARVERRQDWMLRIVDAPRAMAERGFAPGVSAEVHLAIDDDVLPGNAGRWVLTVADGRAELRRGGRARVRTSVRGLAAIYSGHLSAHDAALAGLLGGTDADLAKLGACFAGPAPWMPDMF
jgi:predicted acetyltransferase